MEKKIYPIFDGEFFNFEKKIFKEKKILESSNDNLFNFIKKNKNNNEIILKQENFFLYNNINIIIFEKSIFYITIENVSFIFNPFFSNIFSFFLKKNILEKNISDDNFILISNFKSNYQNNSSINLLLNNNKKLLIHSPLITEESINYPEKQRIIMYSWWQNRILSNTKNKIILTCIPSFNEKKEKNLWCNWILEFNNFKFLFLENYKYHNYLLYVNNNFKYFDYLIFLKEFKLKENNLNEAKKIINLFNPKLIYILNN